MDDLELHGEHQGTLLRARIGLRARPTRNQLTIVGDRATAHLDLFHDFGIVVSGERLGRPSSPFRSFTEGSPGGGHRERDQAGGHPELAYPGLHALVTDFYAAVRGEAVAPISPGETLAIAQVIDELRAPQGAVWHNAPMPIADAMTVNVVSVRPASSSKIAIARMNEENVGAVVVEAQRLVGIFTERDVLRLAGEGVSSAS